MADPRRIILRPIITEKSTRLAEEVGVKGTPHNAYSFKVDRHATKPEIREAVEAVFAVKVCAVKTLWNQGKERHTRRGGVTHLPNWKKAIVTLREGHKIELH